MAEKPILFSTEMVRAILEGRKTMTRRVIKVDDAPDNWKASIAGTSIIRTDPYNVKLSRYAAGDRLWVREAWARLNNDYHPDDNGKIFVYKADHITGNDGPDLLKWRPSIYMPKEAARLWLTVKEVRVERLQEILCGDMKREGCIPATVTGGQYQQWQREYWIPLWDSTIKIQDISRYGWDANPWVWVISFERRVG